MAETLPKRTQRPHAGKTKRDLNERAQIIIQGLIEGKTTHEAIKATGLSDSYIRAHKDAIINNPVTQEAFTAVLARAGVTDDVIAGKVRHLLDAKSLKRFGKENIEIDDNGTQLGAVQLAAKLRGHMVEQRGAGEVHLTFIDLSGYGRSEAGQADVIEVTPKD